MSCEVAKMVSRLYSGGYVEKSKNMAIVGGNNMIFDDVNYYINLKELMFARFKMTNNKEELNKHFGTYLGYTKKKTIAEITVNTTVSKVLLETMERVMTYTCNLCRSIVDAAFRYLGAAGMALPEINDFHYVFYDVESIHNSLNIFYKFYKKLDISSIIGQIDIGNPPPNPSASLPIIDGPDMPSVLPNEIEDMESFQKAIIDAAIEAKKIEKYSSEAINWLSQLLITIDNIIKLLLHKIKETK